MPRPVESASLFPSRGKFIAGGDDMWVRLFDFDTGNEIGKSLGTALRFNLFLIAPLEYDAHDNGFTLYMSRTERNTYSGI